MIQNTISSKGIMINYGLVLGVVSVVLGVILFVTNNHYTPHWSLGVLGFAINIVVITLGIKAFKEGNSNVLSLGQALKIGLGISLIAGVISILWQLIMTNVLDPNYAENMLQVQRDAMIEAQPNMTDEQLDSTMEMMSGFSNPFFTATVGLLASLFFGFIISLVVGLIMKKEDPYAQVNQ
ncbi:DUF4199 domain-containing protein [Dokdonia sinensis]|uniref:DUF4199 domain-containing protein n=1 Tax=Dokdonia sinensis TaxID=2479847 RepID=A0A3M0FWR2_9FLAO|nr:DUF4199 domain-containing protein [Dokdonia sinensis]RMB56898.1 DUF4199 domain-containing protein [Dokdonia sinensis]